MLIIFDVDGTLVGGEEHDWAAFDRALHDHLGFVHVPGFFAELEDVTAENVVTAAARACARTCSEAVKTQVQDAYLAGLRAAHASTGDGFPARPGAKALLDHLASTAGVTVAIATGDWRPTITFKLGCAGIDVSRFVVATASDAPRRADIIRLAAERAGRPIEDAVYVGDGVWDLRACRQLGIPFIGTGARLGRLRAAGVEFTCETLHLGEFLEALPRAAAARRRAALSVAAS